MSGFFGIIISNTLPSISSTSLSAVANATTSALTVSTVNTGGGTLTYSWQRSGTTCTINTVSLATTTFTGSSTAGTTTVFCLITKSVTGVTKSSEICTITWTAVPVAQNVVISGNVVYNTAARAYTLTGTPSTPAPSGTPSTFTNAGTYTYPTNITSITPGSGYTLGTVSGSFVINRATISGTAVGASFVYDGTQKSATVITSVLPSGITPGVDYSGSVTASGTNAGSYTSSITGIGNYQGTVNGGTLTISRITIGSMSFTLNGAAFTSNQSRTAGTSYTIAVSSATPSGATYSPTSTTVSTAGSYSLTSSGTGNYQGTFTSPTLTLTAAAPTGSIAEINRITPYQVQLRATLTGATATGYSWSRTGGTWAGGVSISGSTTQTCTVTANSATTGSNSIIRCIISYSGGTVSPTITVTWGFI